MSLFYKAMAWRAVADSTGNPADIATADALESALDAEAREQLRELQPEHDIEGLPDPPVKFVRIPPPGSEN
jgi:hypothetical protein